jgi:hypothetical protein
MVRVDRALDVQKGDVFELGVCSLTGLGASG